MKSRRTHEYIKANEDKFDEFLLQHVFGDDEINDPSEEGLDSQAEIDDLTTEMVIDPLNSHSLWGSFSQPGPGIIICAKCKRPAVALRSNQTMHLDCQTMHLDCAMQKHNKEADRKNPNKSRHKPDNPMRQPIYSDTMPFIGVDTEGGYPDSEGRQELLYMSAKDAQGHCWSEYRKEPEGYQGRGTEIAPLFCDNQPLPLGDIFEFILSMPQQACLVIFSGEYDFSQILRKLPPERLARLMRQQVNDRGKVVKEPRIDSGDPEAVLENGLQIWGEWTDVSIGLNKYRLQYIPRKFLKIARAEMNPEKPWALRTVEKSIRTIHETFGFFQSAFVDVVDVFLKNKIDAETRTKIETFKNQRSSFDNMTPDIRDYCNTECRLLAQLLNEYRTICLDCVVKVNQSGPEETPPRPKFEDLYGKLAIWNASTPQGAGALADQAHRSMKTPQRRRFRINTQTQQIELVQPKGGVPLLPEKDPDFDRMATWAYYGGRFEISRIGLIAPTRETPDLKIFNYDIRSAYPAAQTELPCPMCTTWRKLPEGQKPDRGLYVAEISFSHPRYNSCAL